jgi:cytochrome c
VRLNADVQAALADTGSPLRYYELVGTQWPYPPAAVASHPAAAGEPDTVFEVEPPLLGNSTLETYIQPSSSCMGCHAVAASERTDRFVSADFTFTLNDAWPHPLFDATSPEPDRVPRNPQVIPPPRRPRTAWDREHWSDVVAGHRLATETYELLPKLVTARLHCGSCHLGAGGDPEAAWWVGMRYKYDWPATDQLATRINGCFERSMNGTAPCDPSVPSGPESCAENPVMRGLITYMGWLDEQWRRAEPTGFPANGYPPLGPRQGDPVRGASVFLQKCAFCHGADGQGRYQYDTYYRPALWGAGSFNASAGMGRPTTLAAFLQANMPYGYGGSLTPQEAWDVACFVDAQTRPGFAAGPGAESATARAATLDTAENGGAEPEAGGGCRPGP